MYIIYIYNIYIYICMYVYKQVHKDIVVITERAHCYHGLIAQSKRN